MWYLTVYYMLARTVPPGYHFHITYIVYYVRIRFPLHIGSLAPYPLSCSSLAIFVSSLRVDSYEPLYSFPFPYHLVCTCLGSHRLLGLMIPPLTGWGSVVATRLSRIREPRVRSPVWHFLSLAHLQIVGFRTPIFALLR